MDDAWMHGWMGGWTDRVCKHRLLSVTQFGVGTLGLLSPSSTHPSAPSHGSNCPAGQRRSLPLGQPHLTLPCPSALPWAPPCKPRAQGPKPTILPREVKPTLKWGLAYPLGLHGRFNIYLHVLSWSDAWAQGAPGTLQPQGSTGHSRAQVSMCLLCPSLPIRLHSQGARALRERSTSQVGLSLSYSPGDAAVPGHLQTQGLLGSGELLVGVGQRKAKEVRTAYGWSSNTVNPWGH